ncbi:MAG: PD-(D/E)XK nuclease family protein [Anaerolineae bacterium]
MSVHLYLAPAAAGKTAYMVGLACRASAKLAALTRVVVPTRLQARAWRRRLAEAGGAIGVRVGTFDTLYRDVLQLAGVVTTPLSDVIQYRLVRQIIGEAELDHYAALRTKPGFSQVVLDLIRELKAGGVDPEDFARSVDEMGSGPRLTELAALYASYQRHLQAQDWADFAGVGWLAAEVLASDQHVDFDWSLVLVDGFDDLTTVQTRVLRHLAGRVENLTISLTGDLDGEPRDFVHRRFNRTRERLEASLGVVAEPLPQAGSRAFLAAPLAHLEQTFLRAASPTDRGSYSRALREDQGAPMAPVQDAVQLITVPDREGEVRAALRWLKQRLLEDSLQVHEVALLARQMSHYRPFVVQVAEEFGLPIQLVEGLPLRENPVIAALLDLVRLPLGEEAAFPWRMTVEAWRSSYFDWDALPTRDAQASIGIAPGDADTLDRVARWGSVIGGLDQWREAFDLLSEGDAPEDLDDSEISTPSDLPTGTAAQELRVKFECFVQRVTPPDGLHACRELVAWLEALIGGIDAVEDGPTLALGVARRIEVGPLELRDRDRAALDALKDVLRGLVWAEEAVAAAGVGRAGTAGADAVGDIRAATCMSFESFIEDLVGAIDGATYRVPLPEDEEAVLVADVVGARGLSFQAVALMGLAEGEFPTTVSEDPLLRDRDRRRLRDAYGLALDLATESAEAEYFYEAATRATDALLLTRPRVADNGATWQASPYWEEVRQRLAAEPVDLTSASYPKLSEAASWPEVMLDIAVSGDAVPQALAWLKERSPERASALERGTAVLKERLTVPEDVSGGARSELAHDGGLCAWSDLFSERYSADSVWSASRFEAYRTCPFRFFVGYTLGLEPRQPPAQGLDARQLGNIYHRILERVFKSVDDPTDLAALLAGLDGIAESVLNAAPRVEQFRPTAWWDQTRAEILEDVRRSLVALDEMREAFVPSDFEAAFGFAGYPPHVIRDGDDSFALRGLIDRVDVAPDGRVRVIDYKTGGKSQFTPRAVAEGHKVQLPLYAVAAEEALHLGKVVDGFYWHVRQAERSSFTLARFQGGPAAAMQAAVDYAWEAVRGARAGAFSPATPDGGCPSYCPAAAFCWHYEPRRY